MMAKKTTKTFLSVLCMTNIQNPTIQSKKQDSTNTILKEAILEVRQYTWCGKDIITSHNYFKLQKEVDVVS